MKVKLLGIPLVLMLIMEGFAVEFTLIDCNPDDEITQSGSEYIFSSTVDDETPCRALADSQLPPIPANSYYSITADMKAVDGSRPGIFFNIADDENYDIVTFDSDNYFCVIRGSIIDYSYTKDTVSNNYCDGYRILQNTWFNIAIKVYNTNFVVSVDNAFNLTFNSDLTRIANFGFFQGYGYEYLCNYDCQISFRNPDIAPEYILLESTEQQGVLSSPGYSTDEPIAQNRLFLLRIHLDKVGETQGSICFVAFHFEDFDIGSATLTFAGQGFTQGQTKIYTTDESTFDIHFSSGAIDPTRRGFKIFYDVITCAAPSNDLSFVCTEGVFSDHESDYHRSTEASSDTNNYKSDSALPMGLYKFNSCAGKTIPTTSPGTSDVCGARDPVWLNFDVEPTTEGLHEGTACLVSGGNDCASQWKIPVYKCPNFMLYYLTPTPDFAAYCVGSGVHCESLNQVSTDGSGCAPCIVDDYPVIQDPTIGEWVYSGQGIYNLACSFTGPGLASSKIPEYEIEWVVEKIDKVDRTVVRHNTNLQEGDSLPSNVISNKDYLQNNVICRVRASYQGSSLSGPWKESDPFFIGLKTSKEYIKLDHDATLLFRYQFTVPLTCDGSDCLDEDDESCFVDVFFLTETQHLTPQGCENGLFFREPQLLHQGSCSKPIECNKWKSKYTQKLSVKNTLQKGIPSYNHTLFMVVKDDSRETWNNLETRARIFIDMRGSENHFSSTCRIVNDPHITTFEGSMFDNHLYDYFLLYKSRPKDDRDMVIEITELVEKCGNPERIIGCNKAIGIRFDDEAVIIDARDFALHRYIRANPHTIEKGFILNKIGVSQYVVYLPRGEIVQVNIHRWYSTSWINIVIDSPREAQFPNTPHGLCGKVEPIPDAAKVDGSSQGRELLFRNGTEYGKTFEKWADIHDFTVDWKPKGTESLIDKSNLEKGTYKKPPSYYSCDVNNINDFIFDAVDRNFPEVLNIERCSPFKAENLMEKLRNDAIVGRKRRSIKRLDSNRPGTEEHRRSKRQNEVEWTEESAQEYCRSKIADSPTGQACKTITDDVDTFVQMCARDIKLTQTTDWADQTVSTMRADCIMTLYQDLNQWEPAGNEINGTVTVMKPRLGVLEDLCPNDCSNHGTCVDGKCRCSSGYTSSDCSQREDSVPTLVDIVDGGICNRYTGTQCDDILIVGDDFVDSGKLTCHFKEVPPDDDSTSTTSANVVPGTLVNFDVVSCPFPIITVSEQPQVYSQIELKISNNGLDTSEYVTIAVVDDDCVICNHTEELKVDCRTKDDICLIENQCINANNNSLGDSCLYCDPHNDIHHWSTRQECKPLLEIWMIGVIVAGCVILVVGVVLISVAIVKRPRKPKIRNSVGNTTARPNSICINVADVSSPRPTSVASMTTKAWERT